MDDHPAITRLEDALRAAYGSAPLPESVSSALAGAIKEFRRLELLAEGIREEGESIASLDKSDRLLAEFKSREERFRALVEHGADLIFITDPAGAIVFVSDSIERILGYRWEDRPRRIVDLAHPGDVEIVRQALTLAMALPRAPLPFEARLAARDGTYRVFAATAANFSQEPAIGGIIVNSHDITAIRQAEEALKEREELYHDIFENARDLIYTHDFNGNFLSVNKALLAASGYGAGEVLGKNISMLLEPEQLEKARGMIAAKLEGEAQNTHYELEVVTKSGGRVLVELNTRIIRREGKPAGIHGIGRDITRRKETELELVAAKEAAEEATRVKDQFVAMVSHDLRAPLAAIRGMAELVRNRANAPDPAYTVSVAERIVKSSDRLLGMLEKLLDLNRLRSGGIMLQPSFTYARALSEETVERVAHLAERKGILIRNEIPPSLRVFADRELLGEVIHNLVSNAIKFCGEGDQITIFAPGGSGARLAVRDTGPGVAEEFVPNLFRHDVKTTSSGSMGEKGDGLGLPICHDIIAAHGGAITMDTRSGMGAAFTITLPDVSRIILLVDDVDAHREIIRERLAAAHPGAGIVEASDGIEALEALSRVVPHLIVTDLQMPRLSGFDLIKALRSNSAYHHIPIVATTAESSGGERRRAALELGAAELFQKPVDPSFVDHIARLLAQAPETRPM